MKVVFNGIVKILLVVLFAALIYEFHVFIEEYKNHDWYYINTDSTPYTLFNKRTGNIYKPHSGQWKSFIILPKR